MDWMISNLLSLVNLSSAFDSPIALIIWIDPSSIDSYSFTYFFLRYSHSNSQFLCQSSILWLISKERNCDCGNSRVEDIL